ncbi:DUF2075 domain-containing protein [Limosilactobacillus mucosae]|uniref:DUF2075 domain-containing protein n=1 Tax=Limosilactobacillus mucosae TaxID=97478 RepID=A0AAJ1HUV4_LIMMU|nr:DUF2075 domain-containing protein [Limosilactobacillus mucosae]MDC2830120.1 DUF2075 domain-containing protein [Limosilactobacillus mucosae]MDC2837578.1 DUF2075 domain-containing protein [Limosilactobacillus mucosae]MDC2849650.1 DUF2075 domain-containing protein [Limosilactobacillus mucosae]MDC2853845.1 DUF2075 domain-containing protein [Limosilactobacillus mucosae]
MSNQAIEKLSPFKELTDEQAELVDDVIDFARKHLEQDHPAVYTILGDAGTGKSVVLSQLFARIEKAARIQADSPFYGTHNYFLVNHPEVLKVYKQIAGPIKTLLKKDYQRPTTFINQLDKRNETSDIVVIDEAHLLLSKPDHYNNFYHENQLVEIIKRAKVVILVFDPYQVLRMKSFWTLDRLNELVAPYPHQSYQLKHQFRMTASDELIDWFNNLTDGQIKPLPKNAREHYDFRIFDDAELMRQTIVKRNQEVGLSRILSTSGYPSTLDGGKHYITEGRFKMTWDQYNFTATPWAELPETIDEVGSIYTCQGFDLNYAGIIIGPVISQKPDTNQLQVNLDRFTDTEAFKKRADLTDPDQIIYYEKRMILNALNVILKRGVKGTYLYAHDPLLRKTLVMLDQQLNAE